VQLQELWDEALKEFQTAAERFTEAVRRAKEQIIGEME
jgi:hypothetical protein